MVAVFPDYDHVHVADDWMSVKLAKMKKNCDKYEM